MALFRDSLVLLMALFFSDGFDVQIIPLIIPSLMNSWGLAASDFSTAMVMGYVGSAIGAVLGGIIGDRFGLKNSITINTLVFGFSTLAISITTSVEQLTILRIISGIGLGGCIPPAVALISVISTEKNRGIYISICFAAVPIGMGAAGLLCALTLEKYGWKTPLFVGGLLPITVSLFIFYYLRNKKIDSDRNQQGKIKDLVCALFSKDLNKKTLILSANFFLVYCATTGFLSWLPTILQNNGYSIATASFTATLWSLFGLVGTLLSGFIIAKKGHLFSIFLLISSSAVSFSALAFSPPGTEGGVLSLALLYACISIAGFSISGLITALYTAVSLDFPMTLKGTATGLCATVARVGNIAGGAVGIFMFNIAGVQGFYTLAGLLIILSGLLVLFYKR